jgi:hypothetical protein
VRRRITGEPPGGFPRSPADWPGLPEQPTDEAWKDDRTLVREQHGLLLDAMRRFDAARLDEPAGEGSRNTWADLFTGLVQHNAYHAGQIQLLKRLHGDLAG